MNNMFNSPYASPQLTEVFKKTVGELYTAGGGKISAKQALLDAQNLTDQYYKTSYQSNVIGVNPLNTIAAAQKELASNVQKTIWGYSIHGMSGAEQYQLYSDMGQKYAADTAYKDAYNFVRDEDA